MKMRLFLRQKESKLFGDGQLFSWLYVFFNSDDGNGVSFIIFCRKLRCGSCRKKPGNTGAILTNIEPEMCL